MFKIQEEILNYQQLEELLLNSTPDVINKDLIKNYIAPCFEHLDIPFVSGCDANDDDCSLLVFDNLESQEIKGAILNDIQVYGQCCFWGETIYSIPNTYSFYDKKYGLTIVYADSKPRSELRKIFKKFIKKHKSYLKKLKYSSYEYMYINFYEELKRNLEISNNFAQIHKAMDDLGLLKLLEISNETFYKILSEIRDEHMRLYKFMRVYSPFY